MKCTLLVSVAVIGICLGACTSGKSEIAMQKEQFQTAMETKLAEIDVRVDDLKDRVTSVADTTSVELNEEVQNVALLKEELRASIAEIDDAADQQWAELKDSIQRQYERLENEMDDLSRKLGDGTSMGQL